MGEITKLNQDSAQTSKPPKPLEAILLDLARFGRPRLSLMDQGWYCVLKLTTIPTGCNIQVESDIDMPSAQCADRLMMAAQKMRVYEAGEATQ